jgi:hypothetical protein
VTRSLHLSRVNLTIGEGGAVDEIVEEELPQVDMRAQSLGGEVKQRGGLPCSFDT